jgi:hypothetical protein
MESTTNELSENQSIQINDEIKHYLRVISKWAMFFAILGFVGLGFLCLAAFFFLLSGAAFRNGYYGSPNLIVGFVYLIFVIVYFFPVNLLYKFASKTRRGIDDNDQNLFADGLRSLMFQYKYVGILTIIIISLYLLIFLIGIFAIAVSSNHYNY